MAKNTIKTKSYYPVSLPEAKEFIKEEDETNDILIGSMIKRATQEAEGIVGLDFALTTNVHTITDFSGSSVIIEDGVYHSIVSITDYEGNDVAYETVAVDPLKFNIELSTSTSTDLLTVTYITGYDSSVGDVFGLESVKDYILTRVNDKFGPERSSYNFSTLRSTNKTENLLNPLKGLR